jgi:hypothetical protein
MNDVDFGRDHRKEHRRRKTASPRRLLVESSPRDQEDRKSLLIQEYGKERGEGWLRTKEAVLNKA